MSGKKLACLIYGQEMHYIDHLAPLAYFFKIPLITSDVDVESTLKEFYPEVTSYWIDPLRLPAYLSKGYDGIISCMPKSYVDSLLFPSSIKKRPIFFFCPHGNSDKKNLRLLAQETHVFVYGEQMRTRLKGGKKTFLFFLGDYRRQYYQEQKLFYRKILSRFLPQNRKQTPSFFYAPTWEDYENNFSLERGEKLIASFPKNYDLLVKVHPNTYLKEELTLLRWKYFYAKPNIYFLENIPVVYPILEKVDGYIGDGSSIGYDALLLKKSLFFFTKKRKRALFPYGKMLSMQRIKEDLDAKDGVSSEKKRAFVDHVFQKNVCLKSLKKEVYLSL
ncbi:MAG: CDP-glycerol glycerophosphotransferase family protein [Chlamydiota bacterium]